MITPTAILLAALLAPFSIQAATLTWTGAGSSGDWSDTANWNPSTSIPSSGDILVFDGSTRTTNNNNVAPGPYTIQFASGAGAFTLDGTQGLQARGGITNLSSHVQTISVTNMRAIYNQTWDVGSGGLNVTSPVSIGSLGYTTLTLIGSGNSILSGTISSSGGIRNSLSMEGTGVLTLTGSNTYDYTFLNNGTIAVSSNNNLGASDASLSFNGGTLQTTASFSTARSTYLNAGGGTFNVDSATALTHSGNISGTGALNKAGSGTLILTGTNSYSGGTSVSAGTLQGTASGIQGDITNNSSVIFDQTTDGTYAGDMSGSGSLTKQGAGTLILSGNNTYSGGTIVSAGTLQAGTASLQGNIVNNAAIVFHQSTAGSYTGDMSGSGNLTIAGSGIVELTGNNTYSGGTTISLGTLVAGSDSSLGNGAVELAGGALGFAGERTLSNAISMTADAILTPDDFDDVTLSGNLNLGDNTRILKNNGSFSTVHLDGVISGEPDVGLTLQTDLTGFNAVFFEMGGSQANTYDGPTRVGSLVSLQLNKDDNRVALNGDVYIEGDGVVTTYSDEQIADDAQVVLAENATLNIGFIDHVVETIGSLNGNGEVTLSDTSLLAVTQGNFAGTISGDGAISKQGAGTLTLAGNNSYASTNILDGTLSVSSDSNLGDASGEIVFLGGTLQTTGNFSTSRNAISRSSADAAFNTESGTTLTFDGVISSMGTGGLRKAGEGTLILTNNNLYTGPTTINNGTLRVNGSIASATTVNNGGTLGGSGTVGSVTVNSGGALAPGNSIGTLNVSGDVDFSGGGVYQVEVNAAGNSDQIIATGTATLSGGSVQVLPEAGDYNVSTDYTILTAGTVNGTFDSVSSTFAFLDPTLSYDANNVYLNLTRNDVSFGDVADTPNQRAVADALTEIVNADPGGDMLTLLNNANTLTDDGARRAYDSLSGVQHTNVQSLILGGSRQFVGLINTRSHQLSARPGMAASQAVGFNPVQLAYNGDLADLQLASSGLAGGSMEARGSGFWLTPQGGIGNIDSTDNASGADYRWYGLYGGWDTWFDNRHLVGLALGASRTDADPASGNASINALELAAYGRWQDDVRYLNASIHAAQYRVDTTRSVTVGTLNRIATADYDAQSLGLAVEAGQTVFNVGDQKVTPFIGLQYVSLERERFSERGAESANLTLASDTQTSLLGRVGVHAEQKYQTGRGRMLTWDASLAWAHEFNDTTSTLRAGFEGAPGTHFSSDGPQLDRNRVQLGVGLSTTIGEATTLRFGYNGDLANSDSHHSANASLHLKW